MSSFALQELILFLSLMRSIGGDGARRGFLNENKPYHTLSPGEIAAWGNRAILIGRSLILVWRRLVSDNQHVSLVWDKVTLQSGAVICLPNPPSDLLASSLAAFALS